MREAQCKSTTRPRPSEQGHGRAPSILDTNYDSVKFPKIVRYNLVQPLYNCHAQRPFLTYFYSKPFLLMQTSRKLQFSIEKKTKKKNITHIFVALIVNELFFPPTFMFPVYWQLFISFFSKPSIPRPQLLDCITVDYTV